MVDKQEVAIATIAGMAGGASAEPTHEGPERADRVSGAPPEDPGPLPFDRQSAPRLARETLNDFLAWAASVPSGQGEAISGHIAAADDPELVDALVDELGKRPIRDAGRHLMLLSTIGELGHERLIDPLVSFIWEQRPHFDHPEPADPADDRAGVQGDQRSALDFELVVRARAVEMLCYLRTPRAVEATLEVAKGHPAIAVRLAAIDAYLFNHGDTPQVVDELRGLVRPEDAKMVGLPRFSADMDAADFEARVAAFYEQHPEERPPPPERRSQTPVPRGERREPAEGR